jgi:hypothetical protein
MTITQSRTLDEQIAHENALIDTWSGSNDYNTITDLSDLDDEEGYQDSDDYQDVENDPDYELYDDGDYSLE